MTTITQDTVATALRAYYGGWRGKALKDVTFQGVTFTGPVSLEQPEGVTFDTCRWVGSAMLGIGLDLIRGTGVTVKDCEFVNLGSGMRAGGGEGLSVTGSHFHRIKADGIVLGGELNSLIQGNRFEDWPPYVLGGKHPDAIQTIRPSTTVRPCSGGRILDNMVLTPSCQGIFIPESVDFEVDGNVITTGALNAIGAAKSVRLRLGSNIIKTVPPSDTQAQVNLLRAIDPVFVGQTVAMAYGARKAIFYPALA